MSYRPSHSCGSQVLECAPGTRLPTTSAGNIFMSRQDDTLQLRLFSPQVTPRRKRSSDYETNRRPRSMPLYTGKDFKQTASPPSTPVDRNENQTSNHNLDDFIMSPENNLSPENSLSPENRRFLPTDFQLPQNQNYSPSPSRYSERPTPVMDLPESPLMSWRKPDAGLAWKEIQYLRADVWDLRSQIQQMRASLREKQDIKAAADDKLFRRITYMTAQGLSLTDTNTSQFTGQKSLAQLMHDCQEARNEYGPLEDDCTKLEDRVSMQEFKLARLEDRFFDQSKASQQSARYPQISLHKEEEQSVSGSEASSEDDFEAPEYHPLVAEYLSKMGDLDLLHERLDEFRDEKAALEAGKVSRERFGRILDPDDQNWLDNADAEYQEITSKILSVEKETERLKRRCLSMNLIDEDGDPTTFQYQEASHFAREKDMNPQDRISEYVKYPLLLPHPPRKKHEENLRYESRPDMESDKDTAMTRINEWMLDKLQISPLDVNLLASTFESISGRISKDWQFHVLRSWYEDGTTLAIPSDGKSASLASHNSSMNTRHPEASHSSKLSQEHMRGSVHVLLAPSHRPPSNVHLVR